MEEDNAAINLALEEDPAVINCTELFSDFSETLRANSELHEVFNLINEYESLCNQNTQKLKKIIQGTVPGQSKYVDGSGTDCFTCIVNFSIWRLCLLLIFIWC